LFSLQQALKTYDGVQERIVAYENEIVRKLGEMERDEQRGQTAPPLSLYKLHVILVVVGYLCVWILCL